MVGDIVKNRVSVRDQTSCLTDISQCWRYMAAVMAMLMLVVLRCMPPDEAGVQAETCGWGGRGEGGGAGTQSMP